MSLVYFDSIMLRVVHERLTLHLQSTAVTVPVLRKAGTDGHGRCRIDGDETIRLGLSIITTLKSMRSKILERNFLSFRELPYGSAYSSS